MIINSLKEVFRHTRYVAVAVLFFVSLFYFNIALMNYAILIDLFSLELIWNLTWGIYFSRTCYSATSMILLSLLGGMVLAMTLYLIRRQIKFSNASGIVGIITSIVAPSCSACAIGLLGLLGIGGAIAALPFEGLEINILALILLCWSLYTLSKKIQTTVCEIKK